MFVLLTTFSFSTPLIVSTNPFRSKENLVIRCSDWFLRVHCPRPKWGRYYRHWASQRLSEIQHLNDLALLAAMYLDVSWIHHWCSAKSSVDSIGMVDHPRLSRCHVRLMFPARPRLGAGYTGSWCDSLRVEGKAPFISSWPNLFITYLLFMPLLFATFLPLR